MDEKQSKFKILLSWLAPTTIQVTVYTILVSMSLFLSSQDFIESILFSAEDFNPVRQGINLVDYGLQRIIGPKLAASASLAVFWGIVGILVNLLWWLGSNFSKELNNNLIYSRYVHPRDVNRRAQLEAFVIRTAIRTVAAIIGIVYVNYVVSTGLPGLVLDFEVVTTLWSHSKEWWLLISTFLTGIVMIHTITILTRVALLRRRVIGE